MTSEHTSSYQFQPAGHRAPKQERKYAEPDKKLRQAFEKWFEEFDANRGSVGQVIAREYDKAASMLKSLKFSQAEAHALLLANRDRQYISNAGIFLSAAYNLLPDRHIIFDLELDGYSPPSNLGYRLEKGKTLISKGKTLDSLGNESAACIINYGSTRDSTGESSSGVVINCGDAAEAFGAGSSGQVLNFGKVGYSLGIDNTSLVINFGSAEIFVGDKAKGIVIDARGKHDKYGYPENAKIFVLPRSCEKIPDIMGYLESMKQRVESGREDCRKVFAYLDSLGPEPGKKIEGDVMAILGKAAKDPDLIFLHSYRKFLLCHSEKAASSSPR